MNGARNRRYGTAAERRTVEHFRSKGYEAFRLAKGTAFDVLIFNGQAAYLCEVKASARKPSPSRYKPFCDLVAEPHFGKLLVWWPPNARQPETWEVPG